MDLISTGEVNVKGLITDTFSLFDIQKAIKTSEHFKGIKSVIKICQLMTWVFIGIRYF